MGVLTTLEENRYNEKCASAISMLKVFMEDAKQQLKTSIPLSTLELIVKQTEEQPTTGITYDNCAEIAYRG